MANLKKSFLALIATASLVSAADARPSLSDDAHITNSLRAAAVADLIKDKCPSIDLRLFRLLRKGLDLKQYAIDLGYTSDEVDAFIKDKDEEARIFAFRDKYLSQEGAVPGDAESYCAVGRKEISNKTLIGSLLK